MSQLLRTVSASAEKKKVFKAWEGSEIFPLKTKLGRLWTSPAQRRISRHHSIQLSLGGLLLSRARFCFTGQDRALVERKQRSTRTSNPNKSVTHVLGRKCYPCIGTFRDGTYDDENQLTNITAAGAWKTDFTYDGKMRRRIRKEYTWRGGIWAVTNEVRYVYAENLILQERDRNNIGQVTYTRGKDLGNSLESLGGVGGLLARTDNTQLRAGAGQAHAYYHADGNGNITMLINTQQVVVAAYGFDSFGNTSSQIGPLAAANLYRFSSKEVHQNSGVIDFLYRSYQPEIQRWLTRDPAEEYYGVNLYLYVDNQPVSGVDPWGLFPIVIVKTFLWPCSPDQMTGCINDCRSAGSSVITCVRAITVKISPPPPSASQWVICICCS